MAGFTKYTLTDIERSRIEEYSHNTNFNTVNGDQDKLVNVATQLAEMHRDDLKNLTTKMELFKKRMTTERLLLLENLPRTMEPKQLGLLLCCLFGTVTQYKNEGLPVVEIKEQAMDPAQRPSYKNAREFYLHTDLSYVTNPPQFFALHSIVNPVSGGGLSIFCNLEDVINVLDQETVNELQKSQFLFPAPPHYLGGSKAIKYPILTNSGNWNIRFRRDNLKAMTRDGIDAVVELVKSMNKTSYEMTLEDDTLAFIDNRSLLHGRTAYINTGQARHINRMYVNLDDTYEPNN